MVDVECATCGHPMSEHRGDGKSQQCTHEGCEVVIRYPCQLGPARRDDLEDIIDDLKAERDHWKANHDNMAVRNQLLRERPDQPVDRIKAHEELINLQAENLEHRKKRIDYDNACEDLYIIAKLTPEDIFPVPESDDESLTVSTHREWRRKWDEVRDKNVVLYGANIFLKAKL